MIFLLIIIINYIRVWIESRSMINPISKSGVVQRIINKRKRRKGIIMMTEVKVSRRRKRKIIIDPDHTIQTRRIKREKRRRSTHDQTKTNKKRNIRKKGRIVYPDPEAEINSTFLFIEVGKEIKKKINIMKKSLLIDIERTIEIKESTNIVILVSLDLTVPPKVMKA